MRIKYFIALLIVCPFTLINAQFRAVVCNSVWLPKKRKILRLRKYPEIDLEKKYFIKCNYYWATENTVTSYLKKNGLESFEKWKARTPEYRPYTDKNFISDLKQADLFYIGQYNHQSHKIFTHYREYLMDFLKKGGVIFFDFLGGVTPGLNDFMDAAGVFNPHYTRNKPEKKLFVGKTCTADIVPALKKHSLATTPWKLSQFKTYGWWTNWSDKQIVPFQNPKFPGKSASMIIQENVMGKGKVIFNLIPSAFRSAFHRGNSKLLENILSYIFGQNILEYKEKMREKQGGPGVPVW